ncbi:MAG: SPOR domain-containing protein [Treponema sp.]|uniref:SPOR domain-containing protein n=1 Tax=Treponema sp. TaxID=166 RepID=UPI0025EA9129|nr:SPOR domain-containing protein [Treponema sp.]MBQ9282998.1 SPOR domain-containing protein [Treponema sp.]
MKKITLFILTIFTVATLFAAARPSLDGRAVVADSGTMPRGLFARTVGYLPGDSVTVTNPATGSTIDVLILGAIDPSEGVAILLSPEAAEGLRIKPDSNVQVKLTKRSGSLDENANGSAVLSEGESESPAIAEDSTGSSESNLENTETAARFEEKAPEPVVSNVKPSPVSPLPEITETEEIAAEEVEEIPVIAEKPAVEKAVENAPEVPAEENVIANIPEEEEASPLEVAVEEPVYAQADESLPEEANPETVYEILPPLPNGERTYGKQKVVVIEGSEPDYIEEAVSLEAESEELVEKDIESEEGAEILEEFVEREELAENSDEENVSEELACEELPAGIEEEPAVVAEEEPVAENVPVIAEVPADAYQPIVLVPAEPNPPVAEEVAEPTVEIAPVIAKSEVAPAPIVEEKAKMPVSNDWTNYVVPSLNNLRSGSYYVQVASLGNKDNIKNFVDKYSTKYPVVLVQTSSKNAYQVMVGPLNIDEYGAVGEKFKDYGFKDSFVRKIK